MNAHELLDPRPADAPETSAPTAHAPAPSPPTGGRLIVAADGTRASDAALRIGDLLARRDGAEALIVSVYEPLPTLGDPGVLATESRAMDDALRAELRRE